ncbi:MAG TPA: hypothetical protein VK074_13100 [Fodinibius sp.]|nr:hypothetical protein [Fodinibius sp.]
MSSQNKKAINFRITNFEVLSYSFQKPEQKIRKDRVGYRVQFSTNSDLDKQLFWFDIKITGQYGKQDPIILGEIVTRSTFLLEGLKKFENEAGEIAIPDQLATTLVSISYSTTRGAMAIKSEGNILSEVVVPLVDPKQLLESSKTE